MALLWFDASTALISADAASVLVRDVETAQRAYDAVVARYHRDGPAWHYRIGAYCVWRAARLARRQPDVAARYRRALMADFASGKIAVLVGVPLGVRAAARSGVVRHITEGWVVAGIAMARYGQNALEVIHNLKEKIAEVSTGLPQGVTIEAVYDRSDLIHRAIDTLLERLDARVTHHGQLLTALSYRGVLARGFALVREMTVLTNGCLLAQGHWQQNAGAPLAHFNQFIGGFIAQGMGKIIANHVENNAMIGGQPIAKRRDHIKQHLIAIGNDEWAFHAVRLSLAAARICGSTPSASAAARRSGSCAQRNSNTAARIAGSASPPRKASGVRPVSESSRSARSSSANNQPSADSASAKGSAGGFLSRRIVRTFDLG